jgi:cell division protein FtsQ
MPAYQGRALVAQKRWRGPRPGRLLLLGVLALGCGFGASRLPWEAWRGRYAVLTRIEVRGQRYLDPERLALAAGLKPGDDLLRLDLGCARERLRGLPRIARAEVRRAWLRRVRIQVEERLPALIVHHGMPWEMDSSGVLLPPLANGALADVPLLTGPDLSPFPAGAVCATPDVRRALAWVEALRHPQLQLLGRLSEVDVRPRGRVELVLTDGTRVLAPSWPPSLERLSALRVVLADLEQRGIVPGEVDLRFAGQVIVRPVATAAGPVKS